MKTFTHNDKEYRVDDQGFLLFPDEWDENFAEGMAPQVGITGGLTEAHWRVIHFIRNTFDITSSCPLIYVACKRNDVGLGDLEKLFPAGYLRGACKLAGVTYRQGYLQHTWLEGDIIHHTRNYDRRSYITDVQGFLIDPNDWDENFAIHKAYEMKMPHYLTPRHWEIIYYLRRKFDEQHAIPTVYETCRDNDISLDKLEELFPDGYHRGVLKVAGLQIWEATTTHPGGN